MYFETPSRKRDCKKLYKDAVFKSRAQTKPLILSNLVVLNLIYTKVHVHVSG